MHCGIQLCHCLYGLFNTTSSVLRSIWFPPLPEYPSSSSPSSSHSPYSSFQVKFLASYGGRTKRFPCSWGGRLGLAINVCDNSGFCGQTVMTPMKTWLIKGRASSSWKNSHTKTLPKDPYVSPWSSFPNCLKIIACLLFKTPSQCMSESV